MLQPVFSPMTLEFADGTSYEGHSFGVDRAASGEVVFNTGMVGYPEALTDPSYRGQILVFTYPLIGNYGIPGGSVGSIGSPFESERIQVAGLVVSSMSRDFSHPKAARSLSDWLSENGVPAIAGVDTRELTKRLRRHGTLLGKIVKGGSNIDFFDPDRHNLVADVSVKKSVVYPAGSKRVVVIDCGCKNNIIRSLIRRNCEVIRVPWNYDFTGLDYDGVLISNGPGNPKWCDATIEIIKKVFAQGRPTFGICLGNQILALAVGADTYKLKYGHRSQNQPCLESGGERCFITSQNHGYAVKGESLPGEWETWFVNANDGTNEGIRHRTKPFMGVQFHPEANPGPTDTQFLFDDFVRTL